MLRSWPSEEMGKDHSRQEKRRITKAHNQEQGGQCRVRTRALRSELERWGVPDHAASLCDPHCAKIRTLRSPFPVGVQRWHRRPGPSMSAAPAQRLVRSQDSLNVD